MSNFNQIDNYAIKKEYNSVAELLKKSVPEVVSDNNLIFTFKNNFEVLLFEKNVEEVAKLLKLIYNKKYDLVAITNDEWRAIKEEYIKNINAGVKYEYIKPEIKKTKKTTKKIELVNSVENIFGENYITED